MYTRSGRESIRYAIKHNLVPMAAEPDELQLDLDTEDQYETFQKMKPLVEDVYPITDIIETPSKSGKRHVRLFTAYALSVEEKVALQTILGSDPKKELCSLRRWLNNDSVPILLFEIEEIANQISKKRTTKMDPNTHQDFADCILSNQSNDDYEQSFQNAEEQREYEEWLDGGYAQRELDKLVGGDF